MTTAQLTRTRTALAGLACPCAADPRATTNQPSLAGLAAPGGCNCQACPKAATCNRSRPAMGFTITAPELPGIDLTDWKMWIVAGLAAMLVYQLFFSADKREKRAARSDKFAKERKRYQAAMRRIREGK